MTENYVPNPIESEPLLYEKEKRHSLLPIQYPVIWKAYKKAQASIWNLEEMKNHSTDIEHWDKLDAGTRDFIIMMLAFFSGADEIVNQNLAMNLCNKLVPLEAKLFIHFQMHIEGVHMEVYSNTIDFLIKDIDNKLKLFNAINTLPGIKKLYDWAIKWIHLTPEIERETNPVLIKWAEEGVPEETLKQYAYIWCFDKHVTAFACMEGIMFSGPFAAIFWLKEKGVMPWLTFSNELISRDEGMHFDFACLTRSMIKNKAPNYQIRSIIIEAIDFEKEFISGCLDRLTGMVRNDMLQYIDFVGNRASKELGSGVIKDVENPFPFMEKISFSGITNFFERNVGEYSAAGMCEHTDSGELILDDDY